MPKHWSEYPSQQPAYRRRARKARVLAGLEVDAKLAVIRQQAAENLGLAEYPFALVRERERLDQRRRSHLRSN